MRALAWLILTACSHPSAEDAVPTGASGDETATPDVPRCTDPTAPCDALPVRDGPSACGPAFQAAEADTADTDAPSAVRWPSTLSDTGCFEALDPLTPVAGLVPYDVRAPLWTEGADKGRWIALPEGARIATAVSGTWSFPDGAVLLKAFALPAPASRLLEVRAMVRHDGAWHFATYILDEDGHEGRLHRDGERFATFDVAGDDVDWWFPSVDGCVTCHRPGAEEAIGPRTLQLAFEVDYGHVRADQRLALYAAGWLDRVPGRLEDGPRMADPYEASTPAASRARAWLHAQCAHCHSPGGFQPPDYVLDLRHDTPFAAMGLCDAPRRTGSRWTDEVLVAPGEPSASHLLARLTTPGLERMPPGTGTFDAEGVAAVRAWIASLDGCP